MLGMFYTIIGQLQKKCVSIVKSELDRLFTNHPNFTAEERESVSRCAELIVRKILHDPIRLSKEELARPGANGAEIASALQKIFQVGESN